MQIRWPATQVVLRQVDMPRLIDLAWQSGAIIRLLVMPGDLIREHAVVMEVWNPTTAPVPDPLLKCLEVGIERSLHPGPPVRLPVAERHRAAGDVDGDQRPGVHGAGDRLPSRTCSSTLVDRDLAVGLIVDDAGSPRVVFDAPDWEEFLAAGADEIAETPMQPMVRRRLRAMLEHLLDIAPVERRAPIDGRIADLDEATVTGQPGNGAYGWFLVTRQGP